MAEADVSLATADGVDEAVALLVRGLRAGDADAHSSLYDRFGPPIHKYVVRLLRDSREAAEDVMVQALAEAAHNVGRFDPSRSSFRAWLFGIARQRALEELRRRTRRKAVPSEMQVSLESLPEQATSVDVAAASASRIDAKRRVREIIACLSTVEMEVLVLRCVHECSLSEIGRIIGRSERAAESLLRRAKQKARERLSGDGN
jgi:RNA polymerase sigma-70 factor (ECF subfamily)